MKSTSLNPIRHFEGFKETPAAENLSTTSRHDLKCSANVLLNIMTSSMYTKTIIWKARQTYPLFSGNSHQRWINRTGNVYK